MGVIQRKSTTLISWLSLMGCADVMVEPCAVTQDTLTGEYALTMQEDEDGDCGLMRTLRVDVKRGVVQPSEGMGCELRSDDWEQAVCTKNSVYECDDGDWKMRLEWYVVGDRIDAGAISGELHAEMDRWDGLYTCASTYRFESNRR